MKNPPLLKSKYFDNPITIANENRNIDIEVHRQYRGKLLIEIMDMLFDKRLLSKESKAIDLGTSAGSFTQVIANYFIKTVTGIDADSSMISKAINNYPHIKFYNSKIEEFNTSDKFNFVMCLEVIEHCSDSQSVVVKIRSLLKDNGVALISMPNKWNPIYASANILDKLGLIKVRDDVKLHFKYSYKDIIKLFENNRFEILYQTGFNIFIHRNLARSRILGKINWWLSKIPLMAKFTQYFYIVIKKNNNI